MPFNFKRNIQLKVNETILLIKEDLDIYFNEMVYFEHLMYADSHPHNKGYGSIGEKKTNLYLLKDILIVPFVNYRDNLVLIGHLVFYSVADNKELYYCIDMIDIFHKHPKEEDFVVPLNKLRQKANNIMRSGAKRFSQKKKRQKIIGTKYQEILDAKKINNKQG